MAEYVDLRSHGGAKKVLGDDYDYVIGKFQHPVFDVSTGRDLDEIKKRLFIMADESEYKPRAIVKAEMFAYIANNIRIDISEHDYFPAVSCWNRNDRPLRDILGRWKADVFDMLPGLQDKINMLIQTGCVNIWPDFDHSVPDWDALFELGFPGIRRRAAEKREEFERMGKLDASAAAFFDSIDIVYCAIIRLIERMRDYALTSDVGPRKKLQARSLSHLIEGAPQDTFDVLQLIFIYFLASEHIGHLQVRSLGNMDRTIYPYYKRDIESGRYTSEQMRQFFCHFMMQYASINNYWGHPFYLGGTLENGTSAINELSYFILDCFDSLSICTPKLQLKIAPNTPREFIDKALGMIRRGNSSLVFLCEPGITRAMMGMGYSPDEARTCDINGCYEFNVRAREVKTAPLYINLAKPIELAIYDGLDPHTGIQVGPHTGMPDELNTFDKFYHAYFAQLKFILDEGRNCCDAFERYLDRINPTPLFSGTITNSINTASDAFTRGSVYNNTVALNAGLATAADSLAMVQKYVYERKELSLQRLADILKADWQDDELIRRRMLRDDEKYGNGKARPDSFADAIAHYYAHSFDMRPNMRGGVWKAAMHSARQFIEFGLHMNATPDGRLALQEISKNASPVMGMDTRGVTALLISVERLDTSLFPEDFCVDVMMHPATVQGQEGLDALYMLISAYMKRFGMAIHFNIFDSETLIDAQKHPEMYQNLQVRVCGWNVLFNTLDRKEQDMYIERAQNISE